MPAPTSWPIAAALLLASVASAGSYGRAYLIKPLFDDVIAPAQALREAGGSLPFDLGDLVPGARSRSRAARAGAAARRRAARARARSSSRSASGSTEIIAAILLIVLGMPIVLFARDYLVAWVLGRIDLDMKIELCGRLLALPLRFHRDRSRGDLLARADGRRGHARRARSRWCSTTSPRRS